MPRYLLYYHRLYDEDVGHYDEHINNTHVQECMKRLLLTYGSHENSRQNMAEFVSLYVLYNLGDHDALQYALEQKCLLR